MATERWFAKMSVNDFFHGTSNVIRALDIGRYITLETKIMYEVQPKFKIIFFKPRNSFLTFLEFQSGRFRRILYKKTPIFLPNRAIFTAHRLLVFAPITTKFNPKFHTNVLSPTEFTYSRVR